MTVTRAQIVDYATWTDRRDAELAHILEVKRPRRIGVGEHLTFLFENEDTVRWQVQEMMRVEMIVREKDIQHELQTYNELLGGPGGVGCCLMIEIDDPERRAVLLRAWLDLPKHVYVQVEGGAKVYATYDERQVGTDRVSAVQYMRFPVDGKRPVAVGCDLPAYTAETTLSAEGRAALANDIA
jgi:hypothetical protein